MTRIKLLLAGAFLVAATLTSAPASAMVCQSPAIDGIYDEGVCANYCWSGNCYEYEFTGSSCYCS